MKKLGRIFANILIITYAVIAIVVTILMLSYNEYHHSVLGDYTFLILEDDELEDYGYNEGSLVLVKETKAKNINPGDYVFLYRKITSTQFEIKYAQVLLKDTSKGEYDVSYVLEGSVVVNHADVIGSTEDIKVIPHLGTILSILESRYGYLFLIVVVSFIAFLYEIYELVMEIKYGEREEEDEDYYDDDDEDYYDEEDEEDEYEEEEVVEKPKKKTSTSTAKKASPVRKTTAVSKTTTKKANSARKTTTSSKVASTKKATTAKKASMESKAKKTSTAKKSPTGNRTKRGTAQTKNK